MPIDFHCSNCDTPLRVPEELAGKSGRCRACGTVVLVPNPAEFLWPPGLTPTTATGLDGKLLSNSAILSKADLSKPQPEPAKTSSNAGPGAAQGAARPANSVAATPHAQAAPAAPAAKPAVPAAKPASPATNPAVGSAPAPGRSAPARPIPVSAPATDGKSPLPEGLDSIENPFAGDSGEFDFVKPRKTAATPVVPVGAHRAKISDPEANNSSRGMIGRALGALRKLRRSKS